MTKGEQHGRRRYDVAKRVVELFAVLVLSPLWLLAVAIVAGAVRVSLGAPVFFRQRRAGLDGAIFEIVKFRTMREGGETDAERLTRLGKFLRKASLDELPQLFNVVRGEMSLVGPRPLLEEYLPLYTPRQARRHEVRPGITGWAQVNGRNAISWEEKFELDVWYVEHRSLPLDCRILFLTVWNVLAHRGVSAPDGGFMPRFTGGK